MSEIITDGWAGICRYEVEVIGQTPKKYRVKLLADYFVPPSGGTLRRKGDVFLVPKHAVRLSQVKVKE